MHRPPPATRYPPRFTHYPRSLLSLPTSYPSAFLSLPFPHSPPQPPPSLPFVVLLFSPSPSCRLEFVHCKLGVGKRIRAISYLSFSFRLPKYPVACVALLCSPSQLLLLSAAARLSPSILRCSLLGATTFSTTLPSHLAFESCVVISHLLLLRHLALLCWVGLVILIANCLDFSSEISLFYDPLSPFPPRNTVPVPYLLEQPTLTRTTHLIRVLLSAWRALFVSCPLGCSKSCFAQYDGKHPSFSSPAAIVRWRTRVRWSPWEQRSPQHHHGSSGTASRRYSAEQQSRS